MSKELEQIMKDKFSQFEAEVSPDLFDKIVEKRSRKGIIWLQWLKWSAAILLLASALGTAIYFWGGRDEGQTSSANNASELSESTAEVQGNKINTTDGQLAKDNSENTEGNDIEANEAISHSDQSFDQAETSNNSGDNIPSNAELDNDFTGTNDEILDVSIAQEITEEPELEMDPIVNVESALTNEHVAMEKDGEPIASSNETIEPKSIEVPTSMDPIPTKTSLYSMDVLSGLGAAAWNSTSGPEANYLRFETPTTSAMLEVAVSRKLKANWSLRAGLRYTELNHRFAYESLNEWSDTTIDNREITIYHPVNPPQIILVSDTTIENLSRTELTTANNKIRLISLPIELEKQFYFGNNWMVLGKVGTVVSIYNDQSGLRQVSKDQAVNLKDQSQSTFGMLNATAGIGVGYRFNSKMSFLIYPQYTFIPGKQSSSSTASHAMFGTLGLRIDL